VVPHGHIDLTKPSAGRIQDFLLGGTHNFEIDRLMAKRLKKTVPMMMDNVFAQRAVLGRATAYFVRELGLKQIMDFGSSLPTCNNTHQVAHAIDPSVRVIYSDVDPLTVRYSREILVDVANVHYLWCDAAQPETLLQSEEVKEFFGDDHRVGIVFTLLAHFMESADLTHAARTLYEWAAPGSHIIICTLGGPEWHSDPMLLEILERNKNMDIELVLRDLDELLSLFAPWEVTEHGVSNDYDWGLPPGQPHSSRPPRAWSVMLHKK